MHSYDTIYKQIHLFASIQLVEYLVSSFRPMLHILCNITLLILVHTHTHWYNQSISIIVMLIHGLHIDTSVKIFGPFSWKSMVLFVWTKFDIGLMNYLDLSFVIGSCGLVFVASFILRRSSDEFDIFPTPPNVCYRFYIFPCFATSFRFILSLVLILFACE